MVVNVVSSHDADTAVAGRSPSSLSSSAAIAVFVATVAVALVCMVTFAIASYTSLDARVAGELAHEAERYAQIIEQAGYDDDELLGFLGNQADLMGEDRRITLIDEDGTVLFDNDVNDVSVLENHSERPEFVEAEQAGEAATGRYSDTLQEETLYHSVRLFNGDVLRFSATQSSVWGMVLNMLGPCAIVVAIALIASALASRLLGRIICSDLARIDLDHPLKNPAPQELRPLLMRLDAQKQRLDDQAAERRQYTANVSHELKTPLTVISGYAEIIAQGIAKPEDVNTFANYIHSEALRMRGMVDDVIALSRLDEMGDASEDGVVLGRRDGLTAMDEVVSLESAAADAEAHLQPYAREHGVDLSVSVQRCNDKPICAVGNERIVGELVRNLAENAVRYNVVGGSALIEVRGNEDGSALVRVSDTGIGIPPDLRERVFERFFRVDESRSKETGGSGLGLAIVKHAAQVHGAAIAVRDNDPQGTVIEIVFPAPVVS